MTENFAQGVGLIPEPQGAALGDLGENLDASGVGLVPVPVGNARGTVISGGDRTPFIAIQKPELAGFKFITKGPGYLIAGAGQFSQNVVLIDATGLRTLIIESTSVKLEGEIQALTSSADYIFAVTLDRQVLQRRLYVLENASGLAIVAVFEVDGDELATWVALNEAAAVVAYPAGVGRLEVRKIVPPFTKIASAPSIGRAAVAHWFNFPAIQRLQDIPQSSYMLYDGDNVGVSAWTVTSGVLADTNFNSVPGDRDAIHSNTIYMDGANSALSVGYRDVTNVPGGQPFTISAWLGGFENQFDNAQVEVEWRDALSVPISTVTIGPVTRDDRWNGVTWATGFKFREASGTIPANAVTARVTVTITRVNFTHNDGYADAILLEFDILPPESLDKKYLYVVADDGATASVLEHTLFNDGEGNTQEYVIPFGFVDFKGAQNPIRIDDRGCSVVTEAAVTPHEPVLPVFRGVYKIMNGFYATLWGYTNANAFIVDQPQQGSGLTRNQIVDGTPEQQALLPTLFASGDVEEAFVLYTEGEEVQWELETQAGGGIVTTDYTMELTEEEINTFAGYIVRQVSPGFLSYTAADPLTVRQISEQLLGRVTLNQAGLGFDNTTVVRHTRLPNDDIPQQSAWYGRNLACRMEGGALQAHADASRASRILAPELAQELARGSLFSLPAFSVIVSAEDKLADADAQAGEEGNYIGSSGDGALKVLGATEYTGANAAEGRLQIYRNSTASTLGIPLGWSSSTNLKFGRICEVSPAGDLLFVTGEGAAPGVAVFAITPTDITYLKTLVWSEFSSTPSGERALEGRFSDDGSYFIMSNGTSTIAGQIHVLYSDDNWETFEVKNVFSRSDAAGVDSFGVIDIGRDGLSLVVGAPDEDLVYVYRTSDSWANFVEYKLVNPTDIPAGGSAKFGAAVAVSSDGFRVIVGSPFADVDYSAGVITNVGAVDIYLYDNVTPGYAYDRRLGQPETLATNDEFGHFTSFNHAGNRIGVFCTGKAKYYLYGINGNQVELIGETSDAFIAAATQMRWVFDSDILIASDALADGTVPADIGAYKTVTFAEEP